MSKARLGGGSGGLGGGISGGVGVAEDVATGSVGNLPGANSGVDVGHAGVSTVLLSAGLALVVLHEEVEVAEGLELADVREPASEEER